jgi:hypothetical protein
MRRRPFLLITGALALTGGVRANLPPIHNKEPVTHDVRPKDGSSPFFGVPGWHVEIDEDTRLDVLVSNSGTKGVVVSFAEPSGNPFDSIWKAVEDWFVGPGELKKLVFRGKLNNEDMFFYVRADGWVSNDPSNSSAEIVDGSTRCLISWKQPQKLNLQIQPTPRD